MTSIPQMSCPQQSPSLQTKIPSLGVPKHIVMNVQIGNLYKCQDALQYNGNLPYNGFRCQQKTNTKQGIQWFVSFLSLIGNSFTLVSRFVESLYQELKGFPSHNLDTPSYLNGKHIAILVRFNILQIKLLKTVFPFISLLTNSCDTMLPYLLCLALMIFLVSSLCISASCCLHKCFKSHFSLEA